MADWENATASLHFHLRNGRNKLYYNGIHQVTQHTVSQGHCYKYRSIESLQKKHVTYIHHRVDFRYSIIISRELINLYSITDQFAHDLNLKLVQFTLGNSVSLSNDGNNVHLESSEKTRNNWAFCNQSRISYRMD